MSRSASICIIVGMAVFGVAASTLASPVADEGKKAAVAAFEKGKVHFKAKRYAEAANDFRRAYDLSPHWKLLYNVGQCEAAARNYGIALDAFERYLAEGGDEIAVSRRDEVLKEIERLARMVGGLEIAAPEGSVVLVDGKERGRAPLAGRLRIVAGVEHSVEIKKAGISLLERKVKLGSKEVVRLEAKLADSGHEEVAEGPADSSAEPEVPVDQAGEGEPEPSTAGRAKKGRLPPLFWVGAGATVAAGVMTGVFFGLRGNASDSFDNARSEWNELSPEQQASSAGDDPWSDMKAASDRYDRFNTAGIVSAVATGVLAAATAVVLVVDLKGRESEDDGRENARVRPAPGGVGVTF